MKRIGFYACFWIIIILLLWLRACSISINQINYKLKGYNHQTYLVALYNNRRFLFLFLFLF